MARSFTNPVAQILNALVGCSLCSLQNGILYVGYNQDNGYTIEEVFDDRIVLINNDNSKDKESFNFDKITVKFKEGFLTRGNRNSVSRFLD